MSAYAGSYNGFTFGAGGGAPGTASVRSLVGWRSTRLNVQSTESTTGPAHFGRVTTPAGRITLGLNLHAVDPAGLEELRDEIDYRFDAGAELPLVINGRTRWAICTGIEHGQDPSWAGPERTATCDITLEASDQAMYGPEVVSQFGPTTGYASLSIADGGTRPTRSWRAWSLSLTAGGTVKDPYISLPATGQIVTWRGLTMTTGQVLTVGALRASRVGSQRVDAYRRSGTELFPNWPVLPAGPSTIRVGAASGTFSGTFRHRAAH